MATEIDGDLEWDDVKAAANHAKHGVTFHEAISVFDDPSVIFVDDGAQADRVAAIGMSARARMLLVVHVERVERDRIISARPATAAEEGLYTQSR